VTDDPHVALLKAAGAVIIGKTNTPEFGAGSQTFNAVFGVTRNPWATRMTPGGSSGGAAVAVAAGLLPFADGSDLAASVRNPAAMCSLVGLRTTPGTIPSGGDPGTCGPGRGRGRRRRRRARPGRRGRGVHGLAGRNDGRPVRFPA
jgi:amidase